MIPLHLAAIKGRVEAMKELVKSKKATIVMATDGGVPLLHLCLKHDQFEAVKTLIEIAGDDTEFMSLKDDDDNTLLHLLAAKRQYEIIKLLFPDGENSKGWDVNAMNVNGSTPLDFLRDGPGVLRDAPDGRSKRIKIGMILRNVKAKRAREFPRKTRNQLQNQSLKPSVNESGEWTDRTRETLMVVAILIASVTFQSMMNPPRGVWQQDECLNFTKNPTFDFETEIINCNETHDYFHKAGNAILYDDFPHIYALFIVSNTTGFVHSILLISLLLCGFSFKSKLLIRYLRVITWICVISMLITYWCSFFTLSLGDVEGYNLVHLGMFILFLGCGLSTLLLIIANLFKCLCSYLNEIVVHFFWRAMFGVKQGLVGSLKFLWNKVIQNKMTSIPKEDHGDLATQL